MRIKISQEELNRILTIGCRSLSVKANLPILSNILLSTSSNTLEVTSTNLETATHISSSCRVDTEGKIALSGRSLWEFVSQLPNTDVSIEKLGEEAVVSAEGYNGRFTTLPVEDFPAIPRIEGGHTVYVNPLGFSDAITKVAFSAAVDDGRPFLTGVLCEFSKKDVSLVATDGYRLSFMSLPVNASSELSSFKVIVPARALIEVSKMVGEVGIFQGGEKKKDSKEGSMVQIRVSENLNQATFVLGSTEFTTRLIEGEFPNWQKIIPTSFSTKVRLSRFEVIKLVKVASIFAREAGNIVRLKFDAGINPKNKGVLTVHAIASQVGSGSAQAEMEIEGAGGEIAFNYRYLLEALSVLNTEDVFFEMIESLNPGKLTSTEEKDTFFHIIMPVRLQS